MMQIVWKYQVKEDFTRRFVEAYGPDGDWSRLFARAGGFLGVQLLDGGDGLYLTIDQWRSEVDHAHFMSEQRDAYEALDRETEEYTSSEELIGCFFPMR